MKRNEIGVYTLTDLVSQKFYVGSSQDVDKRISQHYRALEKNIHYNVRLQELWNSGKKLVPLFYPTETREQAYELEQDFLDRYDGSELLLNIGKSVKGGDNLTRNPNREEVLEKTYVSIMRRIGLMTSLQRKQMFGKVGEANGMWGKSHSAEARAKMSAANKGIARYSGFKLSDARKKALSEAAKLRTGEKNHFFGKTHSAETRARMSVVGKARNFKSPNRRKVSIEGVEYESVTSAARALGIGPALVVYRLQSQKDHYAGYFYIEEGSTTSP